MDEGKRIHIALPTWSKARLRALMTHVRARTHGDIVETALELLEKVVQSEDDIIARNRATQQERHLWIIL